MTDVIVTQLAEEFKKMLNEIMVRERKRYLEENKDTRANGFYQRKTKDNIWEETILIRDSSILRVNPHLEHNEWFSSMLQNVSFTR